MRSFRGELIVDARKDGLRAERSLVLATLLKPSVHTREQARFIAMRTFEKSGFAKERRSSGRLRPQSRLFPPVAGRTNLNRPHEGCFLLPD